MTRKTVGEARRTLTNTAPPASSPGGQTAPPVAPEANSEIKNPNTANGTVKGSLRRLTAKLLDTLCADFEAHGADAIRSCREEQPQGYLRLIAGLLPKDIDLNENRLKDIADDELDIVRGILRERVARSEDAGQGELGNRPASR